MKKISFTLSLLLFIQIVFSQNTQSFTASGNFTVPPGITSITIEVVGAGGNGAGNGGGGGGGGGYAKGVYTVTPGSILPVTIGAGGGGTGGGTSSVASLISATGGGNGSTVSNPNIGGGGTAGTGVNGNIVNRTGGAGGGAFWTYFGGGGGGAAGSTSNGSPGGNTPAYNGTNCLTPGGTAGAGGGAPGGNGGKGAGFTDSACNGADPAAAGANYGGGGGGGNGNSSPAQTGAGGYCNITYGCNAPNAPVITANSTPTVCSGNSATLIATGSGTINWYTNAVGGSTIGSGSPFITAALTTTSTFYASAETCTSSAVRTAFTVSVLPLPVVTLSANAGAFCQGQPIVLTASGGQSYIWSMGSTGPTATVLPTTTIVLCPTVVATGTNNCFNMATMTLNINPQPTIGILPTTTLCAGQVITFTASGASSYSWSNGPMSATNSLVVNSTTVLTVTGTSTAGCTGTAAITQTVLQNPTVTISGKSQLCAGETITLSASGAVNYNWLNLGTNTIISVTPSATTVYSVMGMDLSGCTAVASKTVNVNSCTSVKELETEGVFIVYPNPSQGAFSVKSEHDVTLSVYSMSGQILKQVDLNSKNGHQCTLEGFAKGIYFIGDEKNKRMQKLVVD